MLCLQQPGLLAFSGIDVATVVTYVFYMLLMAQVLQLAVNT